MTCDTENILQRNCPLCGKLLTYKNKSNINVAIKENHLCISCSKLGKNNPNFENHSRKGKQTVLSIAMAAKTHCPHGHEYSIENTYWQSSRGRISRVCKKCKLTRCKTIYEQNKLKNKNKFKRNCPMCNTDLYYSIKRSFKVATMRNSLCIECTNDAQRMEVPTQRICSECGKPTTYKSRRGMLAALRRNTVCKDCGQKHKPPLSEETKRKIGRASKGRMAGEKNPMYGRKLSNEQKQKISEFNKGRIAGDKNPNWKGGCTPLSKQIRYTTEYHKWRDTCYKRDNYTCQNCNNKGRYLHCHHKKYISTIQKEYNIKNLDEALKCQELWDINNGITLCKKCHYELHKKFKK